VAQQCRHKNLLIYKVLFYSQHIRVVNAPVIDASLCEPYTRMLPGHYICVAGVQDPNRHFCRVSHQILEISSPYTYRSRFIPEWVAEASLIFLRPRFTKIA
jgi:hypothetical protein